MICLWISVNDRLPPPAREGGEQSEEVLVAYRSASNATEYVVTTSRACWFDGECVWKGVPDPTHWMPLPEPPKAQVTKTQAKSPCAACDGTGWIEGNQCRICKATGVER